MPYNYGSTIFGQPSLESALSDSRRFTRHIDERYIPRIDEFFKPYTWRYEFFCGLAHPITYPLQEAFRAGVVYPLWMIKSVWGVMANLITLHPIKAAENLGAFSIYAGLAIATAVSAVLISLLALVELLTRSGSTIARSCIEDVSGLNHVENEAREDRGLCLK